MSRVETSPGFQVPLGTRVWRALRTLLRSVWVVGVRDPVRAGRLRLDALAPVERGFARAGLVLLFLLLGSTLFSAAWRTGQMANLSGANDLDLAPLGVVGPTLLALTLGWVLVAWGALAASPSVRLAFAVVFLVTMNNLGEAEGAPTVRAAAMEHGPTLVHVGYLATAGILAASSLCGRLGRPGRWLLALAKPLLVLSISAFLLGRLWMDATPGGEGRAVFALNIAISNLAVLAIPIVISSAVVVVDLALDVSTGLARPAGRLRAHWALAALLALVAVKLWFQVGAEIGEWGDLLAHQPFAVVRAVGSALLLAVTVALVTRFPRSDTFVDAKEKVIWLGSLAIALPPVLVSLAFALGFTVDNLLDWVAVHDAVDAAPADEFSRWWPLVLAVVLVALGAWLMRRSAGGYGDELGSALVVVGVWNVPVSVIAVFSLPIGISYPTIDLLVTLGALAVLAATVVRRRTVPAATSALLAAVVVFSWLVTSRADYIATIGGLIGLSAVVVVVFGVLYSLASDSSFASDSSRRLPAVARPLLFVGYLLLSIVTVHWIEVTHQSTFDAVLGDAGFSRLAIPLAAWLLGRRFLRRDDPSPAP